MIPRAKKNLHACEYHLNNLINSKNFEELEINFAAFVSSARSVTFVLQKEFKNNNNFLPWYGNPDSPESSKENTKINEMQTDELCRFFVLLRNSIEKEGINGLNCSTTIKSFNSSSDLPDRPTGSSISISGQGIYYLINEGTPKEDLVPAKAKVGAEINTSIFINNPPHLHLGKKIENPNLIELSKLYFEYLKNLVEEWTGIINNN